LVAHFHLAPFELAKLERRFKFGWCAYTYITLAFALALILILILILIFSRLFLFSGGRMGRMEDEA
jgi:hypothetical protein